MELFAPFPPAGKVGVTGKEGPEESYISNTTTITSISNNSFFMNILGKFEGYKTCLKDLHWASEGTLHIRIDELLDKVIDFEDQLAECLMGIEGIMIVGSLKAYPCECKTAPEVIEYMKKDLSSIKTAYDSNMSYTGIINSVEGFWTELDRYNYLIKAICYQ